MPNGIEALEVRVRNLEKEMDAVKLEQKEQRAMIVNNLFVLQENMVHLKTLMKELAANSEKQDKRLDKMDEKLDQVNLDLQAIKIRSESLEKNKDDKSTNNKNVFWGFIDSYGRYVLVAMILLLLITLLAAGVKPDDLIKFIV
jgi:seryl-tRNA synthetase